MARARYPAPYALLHLALRFLSMGLCIATLACASYATSRGYGVGMIGAFIAVGFIFSEFLTGCLFNSSTHTQP